MDKEEDYASDTDESDEDFRLDDLAGESPGSEEESDGNGSLDEDTEELKKKPVKRKVASKKDNRKKVKSKQDDESESEDINTSRRATRQQYDAVENGKGNKLEKDELVSDDEDKSRNNALWADFLKDVKPVSSSKVENKPSSSCLNGKEAREKLSHEVNSKITLKSNTDENKRIVTEIMNFAGEEVSIQHEMDASSIKENKAASITAAKKQPFSRIMPGVGIKRTLSNTATGSGLGLGSVLNQLGKKKKLSVLEKSQMDWKSFKQSEGIDEQLQTFNKGKDGYLERQDFLQRTDLRQFEIEKSLRQTTRRPL